MYPFFIALITTGVLSITLIFIRRPRGFWYLVRGPEIIDCAYASANGEPFVVSTPTNEHVMVTSSEHIRELADASPQKLSLHAVAKEMLQPKWTMYGFEWRDKRGVEGTGFSTINHAIAEELATPEVDGYVHARLFPMIKRTVTKTNCVMFFGDELSQNPEFTAAALEFPRTVILASEILRSTPVFLRKPVANLVTRQHHAAKTLYRFLEPVVRQRLIVKAGLGPSNPENSPVDCMQWLIDTSPRKNPWSASRMVGEIIAIWFGSVHQLALTTTFAIEDLCLHEEYVEPLRDEIRRVSSNGIGGGVEDMPLLDSFVKESVRCTSSDAISVRRTPLSQYVFQNGLTVNKGDWVCVPQRAMMHDSSRYSDPERFDGFRFARANTQIRAGCVSVEVPGHMPSHLTDVSVEWPIWGLGNAACPGRFYASTILKLILVCILDGWECKLLDETAKRSRTWRSSFVPRDGTVVLFHKRHGSLGTE